MDDARPKDKPTVSVGMPLYNAEKHTRNTLDSLLSQEYENFELVISDNASTDATGEICREYAERDSRIRYHRNERNIGITANFNRVFELADGHFFMWASHDDEWDPMFVARCVEMLEEDGSAVLCYPRAGLVGADGEVLNSDPPSFDTRGMGLISRFHAVMWGGANFPIYGLIRSDALRRTLLFRDILGGDVILKTELSLLGRFAHVPEILFYKHMPRRRGEGLEARLAHADDFTRKVNKPVESKLDALKWYAEMLLGYARIVNRHVPGWRGKAFLIPSALICTIVRWNWLLKVLLKLAERNRVDASRLSVFVKS